MTAGFPTDDPWGDRQQGLPLADFDALIAGGGVRCCWAPGTRFEYSNLGYALLGRIIATVTGQRVRGRDPGDAARPARPRPHRIRSERVQRGRPGPRLPAGRQRLAGADARSVRRIRLDGRRLQLRPRPGPLGRRASRTPSRRARATGGRHPLARSARREMQLAHVDIPVGGGTARDPLHRPGLHQLRLRPVRRGRPGVRAASCSTAAAIRATAVTCAGIWRPASARSCWRTAPTRPRARWPASCWPRPRSQSRPGGGLPDARPGPGRRGH